MEELGPMRTLICGSSVITVINIPVDADPGKEVSVGCWASTMGVPAEYNVQNTIWTTVTNEIIGENQIRFMFVYTLRRIANAIIIYFMERKIYHGNVKPADIAGALIGEFNQGNLRAQILGQSDKMVVQVGSRLDAISGGQTAMTITIQTLEDGIMVELGQQAWLGLAASLGMSALAALRNPFNLLNRLDDIAQDIEHLQLNERIWQVISQTAQAAGASADLSDRLKRLTCEYCHAANPVGERSCLACGAPLGRVQPNTCKKCGYVVKASDRACPNCRQALT